MSFVELFADDRASMGHDENVFVCGWHNAPTVVQMRALGDYGRQTEKTYGPLALLNVAFGGVPKFTDDVRKIATEYTRDASLFVRGRAHVVAIPGFVGVAVMSFINTFTLLGRPPRPTKVFRALDDAIGWILPMLDSVHDAASLRAAVAQVERQSRPQ